MQMPLPQDKHCTWADILALEEEVRIELIDGYPTTMIWFVYPDNCFS